jgi:drug/metabolite transporter (DMT)-like permease
MLGVLSLVITVVAMGGGYLMTRDFVRRRLRFVDAVQAPWWPFAVAAIVAVVAWPFALFPLVTKTTAALTAIAAGFGASSGAKDVKRMDLLPAGRR